MNIIDTLILATLTFTLVMFDLYFRETLGSSTALFYALNIGVVGSIPMWGLLGFVVYTILPSKKIIIVKLSYFKSSLSNCWNKSRGSEEVDMHQQSVTINHSELPDRVLNPEQYYSIEISVIDNGSEQPDLGLRTKEYDMKP